MPDIGGLLADASAIIAAIGAAIIVDRRSKKAAAETNGAETSAARIKADVESQAKFRDDILARLTSLETQLDQSHVLLETQRRDAQAKFEAREDQLIAWGTWETAPPPRRAPAFVWPPSPGGAST